MKLTKSQRHIVYIAMLWEYENGKSKVLKDLNHNMKPTDFIWFSDLEELDAKYMLYLTKKRYIVILNQCIEETANY